MRPRALIVLVGPALYGLPAAALARPIAQLSTASALVPCCALFTVLAVLALAVGARAALPRDAAAGLGLLALGAALVPLPAPLHAALLLVAAIGLGEAFASWVAPRLPDLSVVLTAAVCLALFDLWSVKFGPARRATEGGLLRRLLLDVPVPSGWLSFLGISDLVLVALLAGICAHVGGRRGAAYAAGALGILASLAQAALTRRPAPALPWIGALFVLLAWKQVAPDRRGWLRTARWGGFTAVALAALTAVRLATG